MMNPVSRFWPMPGPLLSRFLESGRWPKASGSKVPGHVEAPSGALDSEHRWPSLEAQGLLSSSGSAPVSPLPPARKATSPSPPKDGARERRHFRKPRGLAWSWLKLWPVVVLGLAAPRGCGVGHCGDLPGETLLPPSGTSGSPLASMLGSCLN